MLMVQGTIRRLLVSLLALFQFGCRPVVAPVSSDVKLISPSCDLRLANPVAAIAADGERVVTVDLDGGALNFYGPRLSPQYTVKLDQPVPGCRGLFVGRNHVYLLNGRQVLRMRKTDGQFDTLAGDIEAVAGVEGRFGGVVVVDRISRQVWQIDAGGRRSQFLTYADVGAVVDVSSSGSWGFAILNDAGEVVSVDLAGSIQSRTKTFLRADFVRADRDGRICLMVRGRSVLWVLSRAGIFSCELAGARSPAAFVVTDSGLVVLDGARQLLQYPIDW